MQQAEIVLAQLKDVKLAAENAEHIIQELRADNERLSYELDAAKDVIQQQLEDVERFEWLLRNPDATVCSGSEYGPFHIWFRYSNRTTGEQGTARKAIDSAMSESNAAKIRAGEEV